MVFATSKIIDRAPVVKFTFHDRIWGRCTVHRRKGDPEREKGNLFLCGRDLGEFVILIPNFFFCDNLFSLSLRI